MARKGFRIKLPGVGKLNQNQTWLLVAGLGGLGLLAFLSLTGRKTGFSPLDKFSTQFGDVTGLEPELLAQINAQKLFGGPATPPAMVPPVQTSTQMSMDELPLAGAYAVDAPLPYIDWWNNDIDSDDRIIIA